MWYAIDCSAPVEVLKIGRIHYTSNWNLRGKISSVDRLVFVLDGMIRYTIDGVEYNVSKGGCLFIKTGAFYASYIEKSVDFYYIHFDAKAIRGPLSDEDGRKEILNIKQQESEREALSSDSLHKSVTYDVYIKDYIDVREYFEPILLLISKCESNRYARYPNNKLYVNNRFERLLLQISRDAMAEVMPIVEVPPLLLKITSYIQQHYTDQITLASISSEFKLSKQYIIRLFKTYLGTTVTKYINTMRLERSLELLRHASMNVNEIASFLGFNSAYYFCRLFKATYFVTPTEYIKSDISVDYEA